MCILEVIFSHFHFWIDFWFLIKSWHGLILMIISSTPNPFDARQLSELSDFRENILIIFKTPRVLHSYIFLAFDHMTSRTWMNLSFSSDVGGPMCPSWDAVMTLWAPDEEETGDDEMGRWIEMLGNMAHDSGHPQPQRVSWQKIFVRNYSLSDIQIPQRRDNACNKYRKSAPSSPPWDLHLAKMGSEAALISLLSGTRGHENRSSHVNKH